MNNSAMCYHIPPCNFNGKWMEFTIPDYRTAMQAKRWLLNERQFKSIPIEGNYIDGKLRFTFKFLCEAEFNWFVLRWS